jgi:hypothetical protein
VLAVTIAQYDAIGRVDVPLGVQPRLTAGRATALRLWLDDGAGSETVLSIAGGLEFQGALQLGVVPRRAGTWHLWASVTNADGCTQQTGLSRPVTVVR